MSKEELKRGRNIASGAMIAGGGAMYAHQFLPGALGQESVYHGTDDMAWEAIKQEGLKASHGGIGGTLGAGEKAGIYTKEFVQNTGKNKIYLTKLKNVADNYRKQVQIIKDDPSKLMDIILKKYPDSSPIMQNAAAKGKLIHAYVPHDTWVNAMLDTNDFNISNDKNVASYITKDIKPEQILGSNASLRTRLKYIASNIKPYYKKYPGRALGYGAGMLGATALMGYGLHKIYKAIHSPKKNDILKTASLAFETWKLSQH